MSLGRECDYPLVAIRCRLHRRQEQLRERKVSDVIRSQLDIMARSVRLRRQCHDACVQHEYIKTVGLRLERFSGGFDGREVKQIDVEVFDRGIGNQRADLFNRFRRFRLCTRSEEYLLRIVFGKLDYGFLSETGVTCSALA